MILNKVDLVSSDDSGVVLEDLEKDIHNINSLANIIRSVRCQVDFSMILNRQAYDATVSFLVLILLSLITLCHGISYVILVKLNIRLLFILARHSFGSTIERESKSIYQ